MIVGLVQIGELIWERRPSRQFQIVNGSLFPKQPLESGIGSIVNLAYLPHSVGLLQAYVKAYASDPNAYVFLRPLHKRMPIALAVEHLRHAEVVGFSSYVWNIRLSLDMARALKRERPDILIVFGGPQVPDEAESFLREHSWVDLVCHGEGEQTFLDILEHYNDQRWDQVASVSFLNHSNKFIRTAHRPRLQSLDLIPSPFLEGVFDELILSEPESQWLATWETNRGCPFSCAFCDWGSATASKITQYGMDRLTREIEWFVDNGIHHLFVCDANFGMLARDVEIAEKLANAYVRKGTHVAVSIQNTKNRTERTEHIQRIFQKSGVVSFGASISLQSTTPSVLKAIQRDNISTEAFERLQRYYASEGLDTYTDLIIGLPGETYESFADGVAKVIFNGQHNRIAFYECSLLPNAPMAQAEYRRLYGIESVPVRIVHAHEPLGRRDHDEVIEYLEVVVSTYAMGRDDWLRAKVYANFVELLFFDRVLQVVMLVLGQIIGMDYRRMFEAFIDVDEKMFPIVAETRRIFEHHARAVQQGKPQYIPSFNWLKLWWPADQYAMIDLARGEKLEKFYSEAQQIFARCAVASGVELPLELLDDAVRLNRMMFALPFQWNDEVVEFSYSIGEWYQRLLAGYPLSLEHRACRYLIKNTDSIWISWDDWCEDLIRRVHLPKGYMRPICNLTSESRQTVSQQSKQDKNLFL